MKHRMDKNIIAAITSMKLAVTARLLYNIGYSMWMTGYHMSWKEALKLRNRADNNPNNMLISRIGFSQSLSFLSPKLIQALIGM